MNIDKNNLVHLTAEQFISEKIMERFMMLEVLTNSCIKGNSRALIVSGPAGLGKSYTVEQALKNWDASGTCYTISKGYVRATGLLRLLFRHRMTGQVIVFDDADSIFYDDVSLNLLKTVCDTTDERIVSYLAETNMIDEETAERIPRRFNFNGTVIFITNLDFDQMIEKNHKLTPHLKALVSRSHYIDLAMKTKQDYIVRIKQVIESGMLSDISPEYRHDVLLFIERHADKLRELSLRMALKIATIRKMNICWENMARVTCCKN